MVFSIPRNVLSQLQYLMIQTAHSENHLLPPGQRITFLSVKAVRLCPLKSWDATPPVTYDANCGQHASCHEWHPPKLIGLTNVSILLTESYSHKRQQRRLTYTASGLSQSFTPPQRSQGTLIICIWFKLHKVLQQLRFLKKTLCFVAAFTQRFQATTRNRKWLVLLS